MGFLNQNRFLLRAVVALVVFSGIQLGAAEKDDESFWDKTEVTGSVDLNYHYNINRPTSTGAAVAANGYRVFDVNPNTFNVGLVELAIENNPADWIGFRSDLDFGRDAAFYHAAGLGAATDIFDLQQAYMTLKADVGNGLTFKIGKFVTLHGAEVIEAASNRNASRSLLFNYAIPFTHTGVLVSTPFSDMVSLDVGIVNGWNNVLDNNNGKSFHLMFTVKPTDQITWYLGGSVGPEAAGNDGTYRFLVDTTISYALNDDWTFTLNYDLGQDNTVGGGSGGVDWQGFAAYVDWKSTESFGLTLRGEYYDDDVATLGPPTGATASGRLFEGTLTSHWYLADGLDLRFEFRHDHGNAASFLNGSGTSKRFQDTLGTQLVYSF